MKRLLMLLGAVTAIGLAAPAHAGFGVVDQLSADDVDVTGNAGFLESLKAADITYTSPDQAVAAGRAVCGLVDRGETGLDVIFDLKADNPDITTDGAAEFAALAAHAYCPQQLIKKQ